MNRVSSLEKPRVRPWLWFSLANALLCLFVFRDALWGRSLLAPLDVAPVCFSHYRYMDPTTSGVLQGSAQFDQLVYDLPLQHGIYQAYRRGEVPWWDPYGFSGRPLLADAHINGTDPIRLLAYALFPFELAYNWTRVGHFFLSGLTMFLLLSYFRYQSWICGLLALTYAYAGSHAFFFGFPWLHGSFLYYPLLWIGWDAAVRQRRLGGTALAVLAVTGIFYSGNLQSHSYVVLFAAAFALGYGGWSWNQWRKIMPVLIVSGLGGACLAAPVLCNQVEFFVEGMRGVKPAISSRVYLAGAACLSSIYPWMLGDFRTIDARSAFFQSVGLGQNYGLGFHTFIGSAGLVLALVAAGLGRLSVDAPVRRTALWLLLIFLAISSSPIIAIFYTRTSGLFVLGAVVLAAQCLLALARSVEPFKRLAWIVGFGALAIALVTNVGALVFYPRVLPKVQRVVMERDRSNVPGAVFKMPASYRSFQLTNLPNEVSFKNPETLLAFASLLWLAAVLGRPALRAKPWGLPLLLALNLAPCVLFAARFIPRQPIALWEKLRQGGPEQQEAIQAVRFPALRLLETAPLRNEALFPDAMQHLYRVQTVHGYSALVPESMAGLGLAKQPRGAFKLADYIYDQGELKRVDSPGLARVQWLTPTNRPVQIEQVSLNEARIHVGLGPAADLVWTDTYYPGWKAAASGAAIPIRREPPCYHRLQVPAGVEVITLKYQPRYLPVARALVFGAATAMIAAWLWLRRRARNRTAAALKRAAAV